MDEEEGHPLTRERKAAGLSQAELAERVGVHRVTIARLEAGAEPGVALALQLAAELGVAAEWLWAPFGPLARGGTDPETGEAHTMCPRCFGQGTVPVDRNAVF